MTREDALKIATSNVRVFGNAYIVCRARNGKHGVCSAGKGIPNGWEQIAFIDDYELRVQALEAQGMTRSDAQGVVDAQDL